MPVHPEWYSDEFGRLLRRAGLRRITHARLPAHDPDTDGARGRADPIVSKWVGHHDAAFTQRTYVHASDGDLEQGRRALARIHKIA